MIHPDFDTMTIAELRVYCAYVHKVGVESHKIISQFINAFNSMNGTSKLKFNQLLLKASETKNKLEVLGLTHPNFIKEKNRKE